MSGTEIPYSAREVIDKISIGDSTLRKWCLSLEKHNYNFIRTDQNKRLFTEKDVFVLSQFKVLVQDKNMSINNAAAVIASKYVKKVFSNGTEIEHVPQTLFSNETVEELRAEMEQMKSVNAMILKELEEQKKDRENQNKFNEALLKRLDEYQNYIQNRLEVDAKERQHDREFMADMRETLEARKLLAAAQEEEKKKSLFARLFGK